MILTGAATNQAKETGGNNSHVLLLSGNIIEITYER